MRTAKITRSTNETDITVEINLDGTGQYEMNTGVGFFDHMLDQLARHSLIDMKITAKGDTHIDDHHTVEDVGIAIGEALLAAMGDKKGIRRYGSCLLPMDEALIRSALDFSGRPFLVWDVDFNTPKIGSFDTQLAQEFFTALAVNARMTLNIAKLNGTNDHHIIEATFKSVARAMRDALEVDPRVAGVIPSTKGVL